jgi:hypothetical protein
MQDVIHDIKIIEEDLENVEKVVYIGTSTVPICL